MQSNNNHGMEHAGLYRTLMNVWERARTECNDRRKKQYQNHAYMVEYKLNTTRNNPTNISKNTT